MKKIILLLAVSAMLVSCIPSKCRSTEATEVQHVKVINRKYFNLLLDVSKINYEGHSYIMFDGYTSLNGIVHDPDCSCHKKVEDDFGF